MAGPHLTEESPPPISEAEVRARQIAAMYHLSRTTRYFPIALIAALLAVFGTDRPLWPLALMAVFYVGSTWAFDRLRAGYGKAAPDPAEAERWGRYFAIASLFSRAVWGMAGWFYFTPEQPLALSFIMVLLFSIAASSVVSRAGYLPAFYTYAVVVVGPFILRAGLYPDSTIAAQGLLGLLMFLGIAVWAHSSSRRLRVDEAVREQNTLLIDRLRGAAADAESARVAAEAAGRTKSEFLATISHELRTPLNGIIGMVGLLQASRLEPQQRAFADAIHRSGESLLSIINDILDFSRLEADGVTRPSF
jgi:signal transduction histidine kinase